MALVGCYLFSIETLETNEAYMCPKTDNKVTYAVETAVDYSTYSIIVSALRFLNSDRLVYSTSSYIVVD